ncbi:MAG: hypothetical protein JW818_03320 [Pirellulales bacterium]|nr:hypothetical protein [Pirellulales bacterium]
MKTRIALVLGLLLLLATSAQAKERKALSPEEQKAFLAKRTHGGLFGTFDSYCSFLYATQDVAIHTESKEVNQTALHTFFPEFYKPTWRELFDCIARQTNSSWKYDSKRDFWVFNPPAMPLPFEVKLAEGWRKEDRGGYVFFGPPTAPVGMDIYMAGTYSASENQQVLFDKVRDSMALRFARALKKDVTTKDMSIVKVGKYDALHLKGISEKGVIWRQWVLVESGHAFIIVSAIKPEDEKEIFPDVEAMVKSFTVKKSERPAAKPAAANEKAS